MASHLSIDRWISGHARFQPDKPAIHFLDETLSYQTMETRISQIASKLRADHNVAHGDRIALLSFNRPETFLLIFACARIGAILVPLNWRLSEDELAYVLDDCEPKLLFADVAHMETASSLGRVYSSCTALPVCPGDS